MSWTRCPHISRGPVSGHPTSTDLDAIIKLHLNCPILCLDGWKGSCSRWLTALDVSFVGTDQRKIKRVAST